MRDRLVVAAAHGHGAGQLAQTLATDNPAPAEHQGKVAVFGIEHLDGDPAPTRLVDDDGRVGIKLGLGLLAHEERLVEGVFILEREGRDPLETELAIEPDGLGVVVDDRKVQKTATTRLIILDHLSHQGIPHARIRRLGIDGKRPETGAVLGIGEGRDMIHAVDRTQDTAVLLLFGDPIGQDLGGTLFTDKVHARRHHPPADIEPVDRLGVVATVEQPHMKALGPARRALIALEPEAKGVGGIQKEIPRRVGEHHVWIAQIERHVALAAVLLLERLGECLGVREGLPEEQPPPAAVDDRGLSERLICARLAVPILERRGTAALEAMSHAISAHRCQTPCSCSHISNSATCHSLEPRSGVR